MYYCLRWILFLVVGLPFQLLVYCIYPFVFLYFWLFVKSKVGEPILHLATPHRSIDEIINLGAKDSIRDSFFLNHPDTHNALCHIGLWSYRPELASEGLKSLVRPNGSLMRRYPEEQFLPVSGDCLSSWVQGFTMYGGDKQDLKRVATHYLLNCLGLQDYNGKVSARSSNSGINYVFDGWKGLNQPCFGPQYFTSAALFALAAKELGKQWELIYWIHWLFMGGWLWNLAPVIYFKNDLLYYTHHITTINLYSLAKLRGDFKWPIRYVVKEIAPQGNIHPILYSYAYDVGAIDKYDAQKAIRVIESIDCHIWPQHPPINSEFYSINDGNLFSNMGLAIKLLTKK